MPKTPEEEREEFLRPLPPWLRKVCEHGLSFDSGLTQDDIAQYFQNADYAGTKRLEYEAILRRIPEKWREYYKRKTEAGAVLGQSTAVYLLSADREGRPRELTYAEAVELSSRGMILRKNIDRLRQECGWSWNDLATAMEMDKKAILAHKNKGVVPREDTVKHYAEVFTEKLGREVTVAELLEG